MRRWIPIPAVLAIALASMLVAGYRFADDDQLQYLVQLLSIQNPLALGADPYPPVFDALASWFWHPIALLSDEASLPWIVLGVTVLVASLNAAILWRAGCAVVGPGSWAFAPAILMVVPKEANWFGLVCISDHELTATMGVLPLALGAMLAWVHGRRWIALACALAAAPIHAQTGAAVLATWCLAGVLAPGRHTIAHAGLALAGGAFAMLLSARAHLDPEALDRLHQIGRDLYPALINPLDASVGAWSVLAGVLTLGMLASRQGTPDGTSPDAWRRLRVWGLASLGYPAAGVALHALGVHDAFLWRLMVGRGFFMAQLAAYVMLASWCAGRASRGWWAPSLGVLAIASWCPGPGGSTANALALATVLMLVLLTPPTRRGATSPGRTIPILAAIPVLVLAIVCAGEARWVEPSLDPAWREAQRWARDNTPEHAVFVTPPYLSGWRIESRRATFGEGKDGGLTFYSGRDALRWADRMSLVGMERPCNWGLWRAASSGRMPDSLRATHQRAKDAYARALEVNLPTIVDRSGAMYIAVEAPGLVGVPVWRNERFVISRVTASPDSAPLDRAGLGIEIEPNTPSASLQSGPSPAD